jgi:predicted metal-binding membrane protein
MFGLAIYPAGVALTTAEMRWAALSRAVPMAIGVVFLIAGAVQFTSWKARHLSCCRTSPGCGRSLQTNVGSAWRHGLGLGLHCGYCCAGLMAILLVTGVMDLRTMSVIAAAITAERDSPAGQRVARGIGAVAVVVGIFLFARAARLG